METNDKKILKSLSKKVIRFGLWVMGIFLASLITHNSSLITSVFAHGAGFPPFFKINGQIPPPNPLETAGITSSNFPIPQDISPQTLLINEQIEFEIDLEMLKTIFPENILSQTKFSWDFGDGTKAEGVKNSHSYSKMGSYILSINVDFNQPNLPPQVAESVMLNIVPDKNYQLPRAIVKVNQQRVDNPLGGALDIDLNKKLSFDASDSTAASAKIVEYIWDFGDGTTSREIKTDHRYKLPQYYISPSLFIKDSNGFISYAFADITNSGKNEPNNPQIEGNLKIILTVLGAILMAAIIFILFRKSRS